MPFPGIKLSKILCCDILSDCSWNGKNCHVFVVPQEGPHPQNLSLSYPRFWALLVMSLAWVSDGQG